MQRNTVDSLDTLETLLPEHTAGAKGKNGTSGKGGKGEEGFEYPQAGTAGIPPTNQPGPSDPALEMQPAPLYPQVKKNAQRPSPEVQEYNAKQGTTGDPSIELRAPPLMFPRKKAPEGLDRPMH
uniref:Uncharacterized protein n=1 Tax=Chromera velia CCMP2878 TaxID=1169474 RepID=A0A0G4FZE8_9ALVE|eukprot:Cvel_3965.t1-p1 / transcript=Cvel_3965.t1 / gene=Cvel_3965 / organism=Chromera_velia_CCMP2878 / gene_product=hypothetical protein / transcript_product=hypothetical protein / location=Cvel_scaffold168:62376-62744(+) / protein_length=123 / sequence_SO=supercontig / SO=protein_coding / is_pseudo=false